MPSLALQRPQIYFIKLMVEQSDFDIDKHSGLTNLNAAHRFHRTNLNNISVCIPLILHVNGKMQCVAATCRRNTNVGFMRAGDKVYVLLPGII